MINSFLSSVMQWAISPLWQNQDKGRLRVGAGRCMLLWPFRLDGDALGPGSHKHAAVLRLCSLEPFAQHSTIRRGISWVASSGASSKLMMEERSRSKPKEHFTSSSFFSCYLISYKLGPMTASQCLGEEEGKTSKGHFFHSKLGNGP